MKKGIREGEREVGGDGVCGCSFGEPLKQETFQTSLYIVYSNTCLKIISFCSFERIGLPLIKSLRSIAQSLGSQLRL